eukprot:scaffold11207_cov133-Isochrysis_galbana.AAC.1
MIQLLTSVCARSRSSHHDIVRTSSHIGRGTPRDFFFSLPLGCERTRALSRALLCWRRTHCMALAAWRMGADADLDWWLAVKG